VRERQLIMTPMETEITLSVVSHRQNGLLNGLLGDLKQVSPERIAVVLTLNVPDPVPLDLDGLRYPVEVVTNREMKGFGANHNTAFDRSRTRFFCVANPDIRLSADPFPALLQSLGGAGSGVVGPLVRNPAGEVEDSARRFPTPISLVRKLAGLGRGPEYPSSRGLLEVDWVAGMFMVFRSDAFRAVRGFDEGYFLYYEDADVCRRLWAAGHRVLYQPNCEVVHHARRASRRNPKHLRWHVQSMLRFLTRA
jgi:GT2 family glycosyltransferase